LASIIRVAAAVRATAANVERADCMADYPPLARTKARAFSSRC
jgi:hypothetical protein